MYACRLLRRWSRTGFPLECEQLALDVPDLGLELVELVEAALMVSLPLGKPSRESAELAL
jgi:hypothetical protein